MLTYADIAKMEQVTVDTVRTYGTDAYPPARRLKVIRKNKRNHRIQEADYQMFLEANKTKSWKGKI
jgi:hypothetical protein